MRRQKGLTLEGGASDFHTFVTMIRSQSLATSRRVVRVLATRNVEWLVLVLFAF